MSALAPSALATASQTLRVDATTAEILRAFQSAGLRSIVLKGPTLQRELHRDGARRAYVDTDLLVAPADLPGAGEILAGLGFTLVWDEREHPKIPESHAQEWRRPRGDVDLHWQIAGVGASAERAWDILSAQTKPFVIGDAVGESLTRPGVALLAALHAAQHGARVEKPLGDLKRALDQFDGDTWAAAARLAAELEASEAFAGGLRLLPAGERLALDLRLPAVRSPRRRLLAMSAPPGSFGLLNVLEAPTAVGKMRTLGAELLPAPDLVRRQSPLARRGRAGLAFAYVTRVLARGRQLPGAIRAVSRSRAP